MTRPPESGVAAAGSGAPAIPSESDFLRRRADAAWVERRHGWPLAVVSVSGGALQVLFLRWADAHLSRGPRLGIAGSLFLIYMAVVVAMLVWRKRKIGEALPTCPHCAARLREMSVRVAVATGRCDQCGGEVFRRGS